MKEEDRGSSLKVMEREREKKERKKKKDEEKEKISKRQENDYQSVFSN